jgi:hypothetical protein
MSRRTKRLGLRTVATVLSMGLLLLLGALRAGAGPVNPPHASPLPGMTTPASSQVLVSSDATGITAHVTGLAASSAATVSVYFVPGSDVTSQGSGPGISPMQRLTARAGTDGTATVTVMRHSLGALGPGSVTVAYLGIAPGGVPATAGAETFDSIESGGGSGGSLLAAAVPPLLIGLVLVVAGVGLITAGVRRRRSRHRRAA